MAMQTRGLEGGVSRILHARVVQRWDGDLGMCFDLKMLHALVVGLSALPPWVIGLVACDGRPREER